MSGSDILSGDLASESFNFLKFRAEKFCSVGKFS